MAERMPPCHAQQQAIKFVACICRVTGGTPPIKMIKLFVLKEEIFVKKRIISLCLVMAVCCSLYTTASAVGSGNTVGSVFSSTPTEYNLRLMDRCQEQETVKAWIVDNNGNRTEVAPMDMTNVHSRSFVNGRIEWTFLRYDQNVTKESDYQHFVGSSSFRNRGVETETMHYVQSETVENVWTVTGKVDVEAQLKVTILNSLKTTFGLNVVNEKTTQSSDVWEFDLDVPVGKKGTISKYYAGKYSGGQGVWTGEDIIGGYDAGYYYEEASAWGIAQNEVNWDWLIE